MIALLMLAATTPTPATPTTVSAPVLVRPVERGAILTLADFEMQPRTPGLVSGAVTPDAAAGRETVRALPAGAVVRAADTVTPRLVRRGEAVTITWKSTGVSITTAGRALSSGGIGESVRVVAAATSRTLDGIVDGSGAVRLP